MTKIIGIFCIVIGCIIVAYILYRNSPFANTTRVFSPYTLLHASWERYRDQYINRDGRVVDLSQSQITTSEGQSYAMLRSVWVGDPDTFSLTWNWTQKNLQKSDGLFGWKWGQLQNGKYGFLTDGGSNSAADADSDIALALILASHRWHNDTYQEQAKKILMSLWNSETATAAGNRYLIAGTWANGTDTLILNPSYFAPYAWRIFATVDTTHDWNSLISPTYNLLTRVGQEHLDKSNAVGLPPDWVMMDKKNGTLSAPNNKQFSTNYGYDAMRVPWRIAVDYMWNKDPKAKAYLVTAFKFLQNSFQENEKLSATYAHDGMVIQDDEVPVMYATSIGYFMVDDPENGHTIYQEKIIRLYSNDDSTFKESLGYYDQNWLWFGAALYNNAILKY